MNDRFKYRVWDKENKCLHYPTRYSNFAIVNGTVVKIESYPTANSAYLGKRIAWEFDDAVIMQCTGLKDKNGKLIYEGDIVKFNYDTDEIIAVVSWDNKELIGFYLNTTDYFKDKYVTDYDFYKNDYEVIGNIYENKSLLESEG